jgi:hypothetical protein
MLSRTAICLLVLFCFGWSKPGYAQQTPPSAAPALSSPLLTAADTLAALHGLFAAKRQSSGLFLAAAPVALLLTTGAVSVAALSQLSGTRPDSTVPGGVVVGGIISTAALISRYTRYTHGNERDILGRYERTRKLPGWVKRRLTRHRAARL